MKNGITKLGRRIGENFKKRWEGTKNIFGNKIAAKAKDALNQLKTEAKTQYNDLDVSEPGKISEKVKTVWKKLEAALQAINSMCDENVDADENGKGRAYAKAVLEEAITQVEGNFDYKRIDHFNDFEKQVTMLQQIANKTSRTSAIPSVVKDAATATSEFYSYAYAYACAGTISNKLFAIEATLEGEKTLWKQIKNKITKQNDDFLTQLDVDANKVAKDIYKKAKTAKIRGSIKTSGYMSYFKDSIKDLFGMYKEADVKENIKEYINDNPECMNKLKRVLISKGKISPSQTLKTQIYQSASKFQQDLQDLQDLTPLPASTMGEGEDPAPSTPG